MKATETRTHRARSSEETVRNLPLYSFEYKKKRMTQPANGDRSSHGRIRVESNASRMPDTPPVNVSELAPKYAGAAFTKKGKMMMAPNKRGMSQSVRRFFVTPNRLLKIAAKITTTNTVPSKTSALNECVKNNVPHRSDADVRKIGKENRLLCKNI